MKKFLMCLILALSVVAFQPNNGILAQEEALVDDFFLELELAEADTFAGKCTAPEEIIESDIPNMKLFDDTYQEIIDDPENFCQYGIQYSTDEGLTRSWPSTWYYKPFGTSCPAPGGGMGRCDNMGKCVQNCQTDLVCIEGIDEGWGACSWHINPGYVFINEVCYNAYEFNPEGCYIENGIGYQYADPAVSLYDRSECQVESCDDGYTQVDNACVPAERMEACIGLPANARWNTVSSITQTWNGSMWLPGVTGIHATESSTTECRFICNDGYTRNGTSCEKAGSTGGGGKRPDYCPDGDFSPSRYDRTCGEPSVDPEENTDDGDDQDGKEHDSATDEDPENYTQDEEENNLPLEYLLPPPLSAGITRAEMAKLVSIYSYNHPEKQPDHTKYQCKLYTDLDTAPEDLRDYVITACELGLMGYYSDGITYKPEFSPNEVITKAEVVTVLSRMLRENKYAGTEEFRYHSHILAIYKAGIIENQDNPFMKETRGNVIMMMKRL